MSEFTKGICGDGAEILRDGIPVSIDEIVSLLNKSDGNKQRKPYPQALREAMDAAFTKLDSGDLHFGWRDAGPGNLFRMGFDAGVGSGVKWNGELLDVLLAIVEAILVDYESTRYLDPHSDGIVSEGAFIESHVLESLKNALNAIRDAMPRKNCNGVWL